MAEQTKTKEKKPEVAKPTETKQENKPSVPSPAKDNKKAEAAEKKPVPKEKTSTSKKTDALVNGRSLHISTKVAVAICNFIRNKNIDKAIAEIQEVEKLKRAIPMKGEIAHKKGKGMMSGKYPVKAAGIFLRLLKSLKANAIANELELEKVKIACKANKANRPHRRFGRTQFKRSHVELKLIPITKKKNKEEKK